MDVVMRGSRSCRGQGQRNNGQTGRKKIVVLDTFESEGGHCEGCSEQEEIGLEVRAYIKRILEPGKDKGSSRCGRARITRNLRVTWTLRRNKLRWMSEQGGGGPGTYRRAPSVTTLVSDYSISDTTLVSLIIAPLILHSCVSDYSIFDTTFLCLWLQHLWYYILAFHHLWYYIPVSLITAPLILHSCVSDTALVCLWLQYLWYYTGMFLNTIPLILHWCVSDYSISGTTFLYLWLQYLWYCIGVFLITVHLIRHRCVSDYSTSNTTFLCVCKSF